MRFIKYVVLTLGMMLPAFEQNSLLHFRPETPSTKPTSRSSRMDLSLRCSRQVAKRYPEMTFGEHTGGLYLGIEHEVVPGVVESLKIMAERTCTRILRLAFEYAQVPAGQTERLLAPRAGGKQPPCAYCEDACCFPGFRAPMLNSDSNSC
jgi:hypothetical protein